jgi:hypothetical protein
MKSLMTNEERPNTAYIVSLIGGIFILVGSVAMAFMVGSGYWWMGMNGNHFSMMGSFSLDSGFMYLLSAFGVACGIVVLIGSLLLNRRPKEAATWGAIILIFSILSFVDMGGFIIGALLGIIGGVMALTWEGAKKKSSNKT